MMMSGSYKESISKQHLFFIQIIKMKKYLLIPFIAFLSMQYISAQCNNWNDIPEKDQAENAHVIYRQSVKTKLYKEAYPQWKIAYELAPAADGKRASHFIDGVEIHRELLKTLTDEAKIKEYKEIINRLYDEAIACYQSGAIVPDASSSVENEVGFLSGRKAYDMFYTVNSPYSSNLEYINKAIENSKNNAEYIVFDPAGRIAVYMFKNDQMTKEDAVKLYTELNAIAEHNIENKTQYSEYYGQARDAMNAVFAEIEDDIFDCSFFIKKFEPEFDANPEDMDGLKYMISTLKKKECPESDPFLARLEKVWSKYATEENARLMAEYEANNPGAAAKKLYDSGDYSGAIAKYEEAISQETDNEKKAQYLLGKASVQFRKLNQYSTARATAYEAAKLKSGWGAPYMLIGDMYGTSARSCGDGWNQRLAIIAAIDKYGYARSIDSSVSDDASSRISTYSKSLPEQEMGFMRGIKEGASQTVGCWIGETVKVKYK
jgi:hypothetical protein